MRKRAQKGEKYYYFDSTFYPTSAIDNYEDLDNYSYISGNYFSNKEDCENEARKLKLFNNIEDFVKSNCNFSYENLEDDTKGKYVWHIRVYKGGVFVQKIHINRNSYDMGDILFCFDSEENASDCVSLYEEELIWYFSEYLGNKYPFIELLNHIVPKERED